MGERIIAENWGWRHASRRAWAMLNLSFTIEPGERILLLGASGSGKSTLLAALAGVLGDGDEGEEAGVLRVGDHHPRELKGHAALVMQDPESQIVLARVGDDVAFGCENMGVPPSEIWPRVLDGLGAVGLNLPLSHPSHHLSGGQQQRLVLAGALAMGAEIFLLDEPTANLDTAGIAHVRDTMKEVLADRKRTLIVVEHHCEVWSDLVDRVIVIGPTGVIADGDPGRVYSTMGEELTRMGVWVPHSTTITPCHCVTCGIHDHGNAGMSSTAASRAHRETTSQEQAVSPVILSGVDLTIGYDTPVRENLYVDISTGRSTVITGPNGSGKTTLGLTLGGLLPPLGGQVRASENLAPAGNPIPHHWKSRELLTRISTVFQSPDHQFVTASVFDEIATGLRALHSHDIEQTVHELLDRLGLAHLTRANPFTLSGGEKRRLSVATVLACNPSVIILDEPTFGQDRLTWMAMVEIVQQLRDSGTTIISVTHDQAYIEALGETRIDLGSP